MPLLIKVKNYERILKVRVFRVVVVTALLSTPAKRLSFNLIGAVCAFNCFVVKLKSIYCVCVCM